MYSNNSDLQKYLQHLHNINEQQNKRIVNMEKDIKNIRQEMKKLKENKGTVVEKIEYKFDQLKVERLEGTLNIGITPNGTGEIEEYSVNGKMMEDVTFPAEQKQQEVNKLIQEDINKYFSKEISSDLYNIAKVHNYPIDETYEELIINDIRKQINERIQLYLNQLDKEINSENMGSIKNEVVGRIKKDINNSIEAFIKNLPKKG